MEDRRGRIVGADRMDRSPLESGVGRTRGPWIGGSPMTTAGMGFGETPLTDPRSVVVSLLVNGGLLLGASLMALGVVLPGETMPTPRVLNGELDPTDNRAP